MKRVRHARGGKGARQVNVLPPATEEHPVATLHLKNPRRLTPKERYIITTKPMERLTWKEAASMLMTMAPEEWDPNFDFYKDYTINRPGREIKGKI